MSRTLCAGAGLLLPVPNHAEPGSLAFPDMDMVAEVDMAASSRSVDARSFLLAGWLVGWRVVGVRAML
jgi:hypothetical protein